MKKMKALVTGASGFLGLNLVRVLLEAGVAVRAQSFTGRNNGYLKASCIDLITADIRNPEQVDAAVAGCDTVFHLAADTSFARKHAVRRRAVNVQGCVNLARACLKHSVRRVVHVSTVDALGYNPEGAADETWSDYNFQGWGFDYADTKREGQARLVEMLKDRLDLTVIYPGALLGPFDVNLQFGRLFFDLLRRQLPCIPTGGASFAPVVEVARACLKVAQGRPNRRSYICAGVNATYRELIHLMARAAAAKPPRLALPKPLFVAFGGWEELRARLFGGEPQMGTGMARWMSVKAYYDSARAMTDLGYVVTPLQALVQEHYQWYQQNSFLE
jgi:dihydroflavonol-4-reductase